MVALGMLLLHLLMVPLDATSRRVPMGYTAAQRVFRGEQFQTGQGTACVFGACVAYLCKMKVERL